MTSLDSFSDKLFVPEKGILKPPIEVLKNRGLSSKEPQSDKVVPHLSRFLPFNIVGATIVVEIILLQWSMMVCDGPELVECLLILVFLLKLIQHLVVGNDGL